MNEMIMENEKLTESIVGGLENNEFKMYLQFIVDKNSKNWIRIIFLLKLPYKFCRMLLV